MDTDHSEIHWTFNVDPPWNSSHLTKSFVFLHKCSVINIPKFEGIVDCCKEINSFWITWAVSECGFDHWFCYRVAVLEDKSHFPRHLLQSQQISVLIFYLLLRFLGSIFSQILCWDLWSKVVSPLHVQFFYLLNR